MYLEEFLNKTRCKWPWVLATSGAWARPHPVQGHFQESYCCSELSLWPVCSVPDHHGAKPRKEFRDHRAPAAWDTEHSAESKPEAGAVLFSFWELLPSSGFHEEDRAGHASVLESAPAWNRFSPGASGWSCTVQWVWGCLPLTGPSYSRRRIFSLQVWFPFNYSYLLSLEYNWFLFLGSKITVDGDCSHEVKRCLLLGRKAMTNLDSIY